MFVRPEARGAGVAGRRHAAAEQPARAEGASIIRLKKRSDLVEARSLYARHGYQEIPRYSDDPLSEHSYEKKL
jgi:GNAT superfamily N-acetyltransferase